MKNRLIVIFLILTVFFTACQPAAPIQQEQVAETPETPSEGVVFEDPTSEAENVGSENQPEVIWNHDPETLVISGTYCCGFTTPLVPLNYIPDFQIWGDGRYIWVEYNDDNTTRRVLEGQLSEEQLTALLQKVVELGFFIWEDRYENMMVADLADQCMTVNLESMSKTVCEYAEGAPEAFHTIYDNFARGTDLEGTDFVPTQGYLTAFDMGKLARPISEDDIIWPADQLFSLSTAVEKGVWVEGEALQLAWQAVNQDPWSGMAYEGGTFYGLALQIPGLSMNPPAEKAP
jgi:hypothetical protein